MLDNTEPTDHTNPDSAADAQSEDGGRPARAPAKRAAAKRAPRKAAAKKAMPALDQPALDQPALRIRRLPTS